ncbi:glycosyltransferase [Actinomyces sp. 565]|uniref:glycosyltransferase n=1 Tax=Actinomyces sp. 565 TaxID=2057794 RepID=UPI0013A6BAC3|nr:glycosyltransferase [Actinomyces sp. 565]NDR54452.1 glycosyltransferase [Actinomyces sp. 565]
MTTQRKQGQALQVRWARGVGERASGRFRGRTGSRFARYAAAQAYAEGDLELARSIYIELPAAAHDPASRLRMGLIAERLERPEEAEAVYASIVEDDPTSIEALLSLARLMRERGAGEDANSLLTRAAGGPDPRVSEQLLAALPKDTPLWRRLEVLRSGLPSHGEDCDWLRKTLAGELAMGHQERARELIARISDVGKLKAAELFDLGMIQYRSGDKAAGDTFARACDMAGGKAKEKGPAQFAYQRSDWRLAAELVRAFPGEGMTETQVEYEIAFCKDKLHDYREASEHYALSVLSDPESGYKHYKFGLARERAGDYVAAELAYSQALSTLRGRSGHWWNYRRGVVLAAMGRYNDAVKSYLEYTGVPKEPKLNDAYAHVLSPHVLNRHRPIDLVEARLLNMRGRYLSKVDKVARIRAILPLVLKGDRTTRVRLAVAVKEAGDPALACEILEHVEEFGSKDGLDPAAYSKTPAALRNIRYAEALETLPVSPNLVLWESNHGASIGCHPLAMFRWMVDRPEYEHLIHVWAINDESGIPADVLDHDNVVFVRLHSQEYMQYLATAGHIVNNVSFAPYFVRRPGQEYLNTWHGTPFKTLGRSMKGELLAYENLQRNFQQSTVVMAPNALTEWALIEDHDLLDVYRGVSVIAGSPRLDTSILMDAGGRQALRSRLGLAPGDERKLLLYAPTWRGGVSERELDADALVDDLKAMAARDDVVVVYRAHRLSEKLLEGVELPVTIVPKDIDTNELLAAIDILVTDYSSIFFDFMPQRKPIVLYMHDLDEYRADRGLYLDPDAVPGLHCHDRSDLSEAIDQAILGAGAPEDADLRRYCPLEDGNASERMVRLFFDGVRSLPEPSVVRDYRVDNGAVGRKTILFHASLIPNGIASALLSLMNSLDPAEYSVSLLVEPKVLRSRDDRREMYMRLPEHVHVICRQGVAPWTVAERWCTNEFSRHPDAETPAFWREYWSYWDRESRRLLGDFVPDAAVEYDGYAYTWLSLIAAWGRRGARVSCYQHNQMDDEYREKLPDLMRVFRLYDTAAAIIAVSPGLAAHNQRSLRLLGIDTGSRQAAARNLIEMDKLHRLSQEALPEDVGAFKRAHALTFVSIGRMSREKNQTALIDAVATARSRGVDVGLVLVGSGLLEPDLKVHAKRRDLDRHVLFTGQLANPYPVLACADCFILPSTHEGQPVTILEAMALGVPVIASDVPGSLELIRLGYGLTCGTSAEEIAHAIQVASADMSVAAGVFDAEKYCADATSATLGAILAIDRPAGQEADILEDAPQKERL